MQDMACLVITGSLSSEVIYKKSKMSNGETQPVAGFTIESTFYLDGRELKRTTNILVLGDAAVSAVKNREPSQTRVTLRGVFAYPKGEDYCCRVYSPSDIIFESETMPDTGVLTPEMFANAKDYFQSIGCTIGGHEEK